MTDTNTIDPARGELILSTIRTHMKAHFCMPTIRQLVVSTGIPSTSAVRRHLQRLAADKALIEVKTGKGIYGRYQLPEVVEAIRNL